MAVKVILQSGNESRRLVLDVNDSRSKSGLGTLHFAYSNRIVTAETLRRDPGARIMTNLPEWLCTALRIPFPDSQIVLAGAGYFASTQYSSRLPPPTREQEMAAARKIHHKE